MGKKRPAAWIWAMQTAHLNLADRILREKPGWFTIGMRANLASLRLQMEKASRLFQASAEGASKEEPGRGWLGRVMLVGSCAAEHQLLTGEQPAESIAQGLRRTIAVAQDQGEPDPFVLQATAKSLGVLARSLLSLGAYSTAVEICVKLHDRALSHPKGGSAQLTSVLLAEASARASMGEELEGLVRLAGHWCLNIPEAFRLPRARNAGMLVAAAKFFGNEPEAWKWEAYLRGQGCDEALTQALLERSEMMLERAKGAGRLVVY